MPNNVLEVDESGAITIPKKVIRKLGIEPGDQVQFNLVSEASELVLKPADVSSDKASKRISRLAAQFIDRYRDALKQLA
jgi:AbrB family looped-hinge helix DNA binding protein